MLERKTFMSLRGQFFLSVVLTLLLGLSVLGIVACWHARASVTNEMAKALEAADKVVDNALLSLPVEDRDLYLARLVRSFDDNRHVVVELREGGKVLARSQLAAPDTVPNWYQHLLEIPPEQRIDTSPRLQTQVLFVTADPRNEISEAWTQFRDGAFVLGLSGLLMLGLLHLAMARVATKLTQLRQAFEALAGSNYEARVATSGPHEVAELARAFNRMSEKLGELEEANSRLNGQIIAVQDEERADIARDLHDDMGPSLFAMRMDVEGIVAEAEASGNAGIVARAMKLGEAMTNIQNQVRSILKQLRPEWLAETGLSAAVENLAAFWRQRQGTQVHLAICADDFGEAANAVLYRLIQESMTNAVRHGAAQAIWIEVTADRDSLRVVVEDNGQGLTGNNAPGLGLRGMRERLASISGRLTVGPRQQGGTRLVALIPRAMETAA
jgi:two-component system sensor histidine kinase UhpB